MIKKLSGLVRLCKRCYEFKPMVGRCSKICESCALPKTKKKAFSGKYVKKFVVKNA